MKEIKSNNINIDKLEKINDLFFETAINLFKTIKKEDIDVEKLAENEKNLIELFDDKKAELLRKYFIEFKDFRFLINSESDRGIALMAAAFIENKLEELLQAYFVDNNAIVKEIFQGQGSLATFSSKIKMCYLLGFISENVYKDLNILRKIRNEFAHDASLIDFDTPKIKDRCKSFNTSLGHTFSKTSKIYFLRLMSIILFQITIKILTVQKCKIEKDFDQTKSDILYSEMIKMSMEK